MAKSILSADIVSIGLLLSDGNIENRLEDLAEKVISWQTKHARIFGVSDHDYMNALMMLVFSDQVPDRSLSDFYKFSFRQIIPEILNYHEVYMNDEGEHWIRTVEYDDRELSRFFGLDRQAYETKLYARESMKEFFKNNKYGPNSSKEISEFIANQGITEKVLMDCSELF
jgi:hypothetical protein